MIEGIIEGSCILPIPMCNPSSLTPPREIDPAGFFQQSDTAHKVIGGRRRSKESTCFSEHVTLRSHIMLRDC
jgi:hypothetical protein